MEERKKREKRASERGLCLGIIIRKKYWEDGNTAVLCIALPLKNPSRTSGRLAATGATPG